MAFVQYLVFDGVALPLPDSYEVQMDDVEADSGGETEAGTTQRDVVRLGVVSIAVSFSVSPRWLKVLTGFKQREKISVGYFNTETLEMKEAEMFAGMQSGENFGTICIPVYVGGTLLDEVVVDAQARQNLRSGGR